VISEIIAAVEALVPVPTSIGPENVFINAEPPRIVWVPTSDDYGPPESPGQNGRPVRTRFAGAEVYVWGTDYDAAETIVHLVIGTIHQLMGGNYEISKGKWLATDGRNVVCGRAYVFRATFKIPVCLPADVLVKPGSKLTHYMEPGDDPG
jgi:hypothetical protein